MGIKLIIYIFHVKRFLLNPRGYDYIFTFMNSFIKQAAASFAGISDRLTGSWTTKAALNSRIEEYGQMLDLKIDSEKKQITAKILLNGEKEPFRIAVDGYELWKDGDKAFLRINSAGADRQWLNTLLKNYVSGKSFPIPAEAGGVAESIL